jgi:N-carbamoyl-L-amino-acid hydrolase
MLDAALPRNDGPVIAIDGDRLMADLRRLAEFGRVGTGVHRRALSGIDMDSRRWLIERMRAAGLEAECDGIGNVYGRTPHARRIVIGSHSDTVPAGGWLDGAMGVIVGLEIARAFLEKAGNGDIGLEVVSFSDEEGRFSTLLGSRSFTGDLDEAMAAEAVNEDGVSLARALGTAGLSGRARLRLDPAVHIAFLEAHIEQGPVLETRGARIGSVTAIAGLRGWTVRFEGRADHAGTTPMALRADAGAALCAFAVRFADFCRASGSPHSVWNGGAIGLSPGAHNVVPAQADYLLTVRDPSPDVLDRLAAGVVSVADAVAADHGVGWRKDDLFDLAPAQMDAALTAEIEMAARLHGVEPLAMPSGAGHDAMVLARYVPTAMLFVPSIGGRSHHVAEDTDEADILLGARILAEAVMRLCQIL